MLIGSKQASQILDCSSAYIRQLCADEAIKKQLNAQKIGKSWVFEEIDVKKFAEMKRQKNN